MTAPTDDKDAAEPLASLGSTTPGNAEDSKQADPTSTSPADPTSPTSSLTPPPDTTSPAFPSADLPDGESSTQHKVEGSEGEAEAKLETSAEIEKASRASTPLSELSSAPDADDPPDGDKKAATDDTVAATSAKNGDGGKPVAEAAGSGSGKPSGETKSSINGHVGAATAESSAPTQATVAPVTHQPRPSVVPKTESLSGSRAPSLSISSAYSLFACMHPTSMFF